MKSGHQGVEEDFVGFVVLCFEPKLTIEKLSSCLNGCITIL
jgi:hypothetical protein